MGNRFLQCWNTDDEHFRGFDNEQDNRILRLGLGDVENFPTFYGNPNPQRISYGRNILQNLRQEEPNIIRARFMTAHLVSCPDIPVKHAGERDEATCQLIDMHTSEKRLTIADYVNKCIKIFNRKTGKMTRKIRFEKASVCLSELSVDGSEEPLYCVGFEGETEIHIMDLISKPDEIHGVIPVNGYFESVYFSNSNIYVLLCPDNVSRKLQVINEDGKTLNIIDVGSDLGGEEFKSCFVHDVTGTMYVQSSTKIIHLDHTGHILNTFSFELDLPEGHTLSFGLDEPEFGFDCCSICVDNDRNVHIVRPKFHGHNLDGYIMFTFTQDLKLLNTLHFSKPGRSFKLMRCQEDMFYFAEPLNDRISVFKKE